MKVTKVWILLIQGTRETLSWPDQGQTYTNKVQAECDPSTLCSHTHEDPYPHRALGTVTTVTARVEDVSHRNTAVWPFTVPISTLL